MEICLKLLPRKSYDKNGLFLLMIFVSIGVVVIGIAGIFEAKATFQCNPDKIIASDVSTRKYIDTQCFLKYTQEFYTSLPIYVLVLMNFGIVYLLSIIYAHLVENRVEIFTEPRSVKRNDAEEESQPLSAGITAAGADPAAYRKLAGRYVIFPAYVTHLIVCRIIPLVVFAVLLLSSANFPVQFKCHLPTKTTSISPANITQSGNFSIVDCTYPMGSKNEILAATVATVNLVVCTMAFVELVYLLCSALKDHNLLTDREFCCIYLFKGFPCFFNYSGILHGNSGISTIQRSYFSRITRVWNCLNYYSKIMDTDISQTFKTICESYLRTFRATAEESDKVEPPFVATKTLAYAPQPAAPLILKVSPSKDKKLRTFVG